MSERQIGRDVGDDVWSKDEDDLSPEAPGRMSFLDHLDELRRRILYSVYSVLAACVISFAFINRILEFVTTPMLAVLPNHKLLATEALDPIMLWFKAGLLMAVIIASPLIMLQVWYFIAPGLYSKEKRVAIPFVFSSSALFLAGAYFGHRLAFRVTWDFLAEFNKGLGFQDWMPTAASAFSLYLRIVIGLGLVFQMPTVIFVLARFGIVSARFLIKNFKYAVLIIFIVAAVASPGQDPFSQLVFAAPMLVLYVISIGVAWLFGKKKPVES
ncbi:MAG: twin-arginine translocase subunit TatC [Vicinamibacterales bacterium]